MDEIQQQLFYRSFELDRATVNKEERSVDLSFSSETPAERWFGKEILLHGAKNVDLSRLKTMGSALMNHDPNLIVGRIQDARIENKRGKAKVFFDNDEDGSKALFKVKSGSLSGVSFGYQVQKFVKILDGESYQGFQGPAHIATRWTPYEISLTPIPADASVGVGRAITRSLDGIEIEPLTIRQEGFKMDKRNQRVISEKDRERLRFFMNVCKMIDPADLELRSEIMDDFAYDRENIYFRLNQRFAQFQQKKGKQDLTGNELRQPITSFAQIDDAMFFRALTNPDSRPPNGKSNITFKNTDDSVFFRALTNPDSTYR